ncbi:MAG: hypothetical protein Rubg2KO_07810 [Rubricoccaceae bacterium]
MEADPRDRVTQTAFQITPDLIGIELASPWRRALAFGLDLLLAGIVSETGGGAAVGLVAAILFILVAMRTPSKSRPRRVGRAALVSLGALMLFGIAAGIVDDARSDDEDTEWADAGVAANEAALAEADRQLDAANVDLGMELEDLVRAGEASEPDTALTQGDRDEAAQTLRQYADAVLARDTVRADSLRPEAIRWIAGAELAQRDARIERLRDRERRVADERDELQEAVDDPSFLRPLLTAAADFGLTLGWIGLYFTLTLAWWGGYTPGKRLLRIRVMRLDGKRLGLWNAFERFGGYAAGLVTGLLGFAQVFWDPNRQGVQDKIAATVVVRMRDSKTPRRRA